MRTTRRGDVNREAVIRRHALRLAALGGLIIGWNALAARYGNPLVLPSPRYVVEVSLQRFAVFYDDFVPLKALNYPVPEWIRACIALGVATIATGIRAALGLLIGEIAGIAIAVALYSPLRPTFIGRGFLIAARGVPLLALIPLFVMWFSSLPFLATMMYVGFAVAVVVASDSYSALSRLPLSYTDRAILELRSPWRVLFARLVPAMMRSLRPGIKTAVGLSWSFAVGAEFIVNEIGLGRLLRRSYQHPDMGRIAIVAIIFIFVGIMSVWLSDKIFTRISAWRATMSMVPKNTQTGMPQ